MLEIRDDFISHASAESAPQFQIIGASSNDLNLAMMYDTSEECPDCQARFDREWEAKNPKSADDASDRDGPEAE